jgi:heme-degrading monooxygenase HmoA
MFEAYSTGSWRPLEGRDDEFVEAWRLFAGWATTMPGAGPATLARDVRDPRRFVSFIGWQSMDALRAWKSSDEFRPRMSDVQQFVDTFEPTELEVVALAERASVTEPPGGAA